MAFKADTLAMLSIAAETMKVKSHKDGAPVSSLVMGAALAMQHAYTRTIYGLRSNNKQEITMYPMVFSRTAGEEWASEMLFRGMEFNLNGEFMREVLDLVFDMKNSDTAVEYCVESCADLCFGFETMTMFFAAACNAR